MAITLRIPGRPEAAPTAAARSDSPAAPDRAKVTDLLDDVEVVHAFSLSPSARAQGAAQPQEVQAQDDDILELEVGGFTLWTSALRYEETTRAFRPEAITGGTVTVDALPSSDAATRGGDRGVSAVRILRLAKARLEDELQDPKIVEEFSREFGLKLVERAGSWVMAKAITWLVERRLRPHEGLYAWTQATRAAQAGAAGPAPATFEGFDASQPILLFLHGTGSSTLGSFGEFLEEGAKDQWKDLTGFFKQHIYAFEHKTLSRSPIENAIMVANQLPAMAKLNLVSHSRGGMIGDLLCLGGLDAARIAAFTRHGKFDDADMYDRQKLRELATILAEKRFRVQRFARAASPARGTLLASENMDQFLSVITHLLGLIPFLRASALYEVIKRITLETVRRRWEPGVLPGLEAMTPSSPLVRLLNTTGDEAAGALGVIAGDIQGGNWLKRFGVFISDRMIYANRDNDLVVNTDSMFGGASRRTARYVFDQGSDVSHFNYFKNPRTRAHVSQWMTAKSEVALADFRSLEEAKIKPVPMERAAESRASATRPIVVLVPDTMGSDLHAGSSRVWLDYDALTNGGFEQLADAGPTTTVRTRSVLGEHYKPLHDYLSSTHDVVPFAYDWRLSTATTADSLGAAINAILDEPKQPVRILAHGMGGLVVRQLMTGGADSPWGKLCAREDSRVVLLGTPHKGTYDSVELLLGTHPVAQQIALLDHRLGPRKVSEIFQAFPGILELLPRNGETNFFAPDTWQAFSDQRLGAAAPDAALLDRARNVCDALGAQRAGAARVCNVAGAATRTVCGVEPTERPLTLEVTTEGDGRVTYDSTRLHGVVTWYLDAGHGELASDPRGFPAIVELLQTGATTHLPTTEPSVSRGGEQRRRTLPERVLYPTAEDLSASVFDRAPSRPYRAAEPASFRVSVVHGDLTFARNPIIVGHYENDTIIGPEAVVDRLFDGALTTRYNLGLYPGPLGTFSIVLREPMPLQRALQLPMGAIVVGLGRWGELTAGQIANIVRRGALEYVLQLDGQSPRAERGGGAPSGSKDIGLSVLLIGATASNISTQDSVAAIMRGIAQANLELESIVERVATRIGSIEIVELFVDTAIEAARAARDLAQVLSDELKIRIQADPFLQRGRYGRVRFAAARNLDAWRRWEITAERSIVCRPQLPERLRTWLDEFTRRDKVDPALLGALAGMALADPQEPPPDRMRFVSLSDRARAEVMMEQHQPSLIERLIRSSITDTRFNAAAARALFELMVPNDLKDGLGLLSNVVFVLDAHTSAYPWELMTDGGDRPLWTRVRMVRQLQSASFRAQIRATTVNTAYVVGDPRVTPPFKQLKGARDEAQVVAEKLKSHNFEPTLLPPEATALDVLGGLFARPYRIVHLAGHGDYQPHATADARARSGMVLDDGTFLTASEVRKMLQVPELVFLNCCSIGQIGPEPVESPRYVAYNLLAASISRELIQMGVRAVVAAGWAVRDDAALFFAKAFYDEMLGGETFGRALGKARTSTWLQFPDANTWGAYQAYGDPDFRLIREQRTVQPPERVAPEELLQQIDKVWRRAQDLKRGNDVDSTPEQEKESARDKQADELGELLKQVPPEWLKRSDVRVAIGEAYGELALFPEAIEHLELALDTGELNSKTTMKAAEQLLNFMVRRAAKERNEKDLRGAIRRLEALRDVRPSSERFNLLGSAYKRLATLLVDAGAVKQAIGMAAENYDKAAKHNAERGEFQHYPVVNWLALAAILGEQPQDWESLLAEAEMNARECFVRDRSAFHATAPADISVVRALIADKLSTENDDRTDAIGRITDLYREAFRRAQATPRQVASATDQLETLESYLEKFDPTANVLTRAALKEIRERLA